MTDCQVPPTAPCRCRNYDPSAGPGPSMNKPLRDLMLIVSTLAPIALAAAGWMWSLSGQLASVVQIERRVTAVEADSSTREQQLATAVERLARIESMVAMLAEMAKQQKSPARVP